MAQIMFNHVGANHRSLMAHHMIIEREREDVFLLNQ
jgi:hypothetical protein